MGDRIGMGTLSARALRESLQKARNVGIVEERFTLFGEIELVVRNLRPDEYEHINKDCADQEGLDYLYAFQEGHVKRAIVEVNGQDLREVQFVEDEEEDPKKPGTTKTVKLELADWLYRNFISTWSKEALYVVFRKVEDAVGRAEKKAKDGIEFISPDESDEDRFRRIVGELKDLEDNLPVKLVDHVLEEAGYMRKSTADEIKRAMDKATQLAREEEAARKAAAGEGSPPPAPAASAPPAPPAAPPPAAPVAAAPSGPDPNDLMRNRQPMNQAAVDVPQPVIISPGARQVPVPATRQPQPGPPPPDQVHPPIQGAIPGPALHGSAAVRSAKHAALEAEADAAGALQGEGGQLPPKPTDVPIIERKQTPIDPKAAASVIDPKPRGGINPHFRPPPRNV
jgi:hypothetical protein